MSKERGAGTVEDVEEVPPGLEDGPGARDADGVWSPIRVAFTRWNVGAPVARTTRWNGFEPVAEPSWDDFAGYDDRHGGRNGETRYCSDYTPSFLGQCNALGDNRFSWQGSFGRFLHREEMNLHPAGEYLEMYDRLVGREWRDKPERMNFLNKHDHLPLVHIIVNKSDGVSKSRGHYDLFFPHKLHFGVNDTIYYMNEYNFSDPHQRAREGSAENAGACPHCATRVDDDDVEELKKTSGTVYHIKSGPSSRFPTDEIYGYREYGQEITEKNTLKGRPGGIIVHLPKGNQVNRIYLPRRVVHKVSGKGARWDSMKIFPSN